MRSSSPPRKRLVLRAGLVMTLLSTPILLAAGALPLPGLGGSAVTPQAQECVWVITPAPFPSETDVCTPPGTGAS